MSERGRLVAYLIVCAVLSAAALLVQVGFGAYGMSVTAAWGALFDADVLGDPATLGRLLRGEDVASLETSTVVVWSVRLPRVVGALLVGAALAVSGAIFQAITRNDLASPYILGVSAGAGLTVLLVLVFASALLPVLPLLAAAGAGAAFLVVYVLAWQGGTSSVRLVLAGVVVASILGSIQLGVFLFAENLETVHTAIAWTAGSLVGVDWPPVLRAAPWILLLLLGVLFASRQLDVLSLGDPMAAGLGMPIERTRFALAAIGVVLAATSVTIAGTVGFVGLILPHVSRNIVGAEHRRVLIASAAGGGTLLLVADTAARLAFSPIQVPVGIFTGILGGGYFLFLMRRSMLVGVADARPGGRRETRAASATPGADRSRKDRAAGLEAESLTIGYGGGAPVVDDVSLAAPPHRLTAIVGPNGSGKSSVVRGLARQLVVRAGHVTHSGEDLGGLGRRELARRLAVLQQEHDARPPLTVEALVMHGRHPHRRMLGRPGFADHAAVDTALRRSGIEDLRDRRIGSLSGGQRQLAWLAMALAQETDVLLLDEPTTFLDIAHQHELLALMRGIAHEGVTVVAVLHDLEHALRFADHLVVVHEGGVKGAGPPLEVLTPELLAEVFGIRARVEAGNGHPPSLRVEGLEDGDPGTAESGR
ncbi:MAG: iron chelate uptake ABC transporter family permease subunit [Planctomycetota bacterium]